MTVQRLVVDRWHPLTNVNGSNSKGHWSEIARRHEVDKNRAWASAKQAGWVFVPGKVKLTVTLVYPRNTLPDSDNAYAKCKGLIDGLKSDKRRQGFFADDNPAHLELVVRAVVEKGRKQVRIELEPAEVVV